MSVLSKLRRVLNLFFLLILSFEMIAVSSVCAGPPGVEEKVHRLKWTLETFSESVKSTRQHFAWTFIGLGVGSLAAGIVLKARRDGLKSDLSLSQDNIADTVLGFGIGLTVIGGVLVAIPTAFENDWQKQAHQLESLPIAEQLKGYEILFKERAEEDHSNRITSSFLGFAIAGLGTGIYFASPRTSLNQFWLRWAGLGLGSGLVNRFQKSYREKEWEKYQSWAGDSAGEIANAGTFEFAVLPKTDGAGAGLSYRF